MFILSSREIYRLEPTFDAIVFANLRFPSVHTAPKKYSVKKNLQSKHSDFGYQKHRLTVWMEGVSGGGKKLNFQKYPDMCGTRTAD